MDIKGYARERLKKSADEAAAFWNGVKARFSRDIIEGDENFRVIDIQKLSDDCIDLIVLRDAEDSKFEQVENWRIVAEKKWFKKPMLKMHFISGPLLDEFFDDK